MLQTISKRDQFPEDFGFNMRKYMLTRLKEMNKMVLDAEDEIPDYYWIETNQFVKDDIDHFSKRVRLSLQDSDVNNPTALKLFWKIRCRLDPSRGECKESPDQKSKREKQLADKQREEKRLVLEQKQREQKKRSKANLVREQKQLEQEKLALEQQRIQKEKLERELIIEQQRLKKERLALEQERLKQEKLRQKQEQIIQEKLKLEDQRLALEKASQESERSIWEILFGWLWSWI